MRIEERDVGARLDTYLTLHAAGEARARRTLTGLALPPRPLSQLAGLLAATTLVRASLAPTSSTPPPLLTSTPTGPLPSPELLVDCWSRLRFAAAMLAGTELDDAAAQLLRDALRALQRELSELRQLSPTLICDTAVLAERDWRRWLDQTAEPAYPGGLPTERPLRWAAPSDRIPRPGLCVVEDVPERSPFALLRAAGAVLARRGPHVLLALGDLSDELTALLTPRPDRLGAGAHLRAALHAPAPDPALAELTLALHLDAPGLPRALELARCALTSPPAASGPAAASGTHSPP